MLIPPPIILSRRYSNLLNRLEPIDILWQGISHLHSHQRIKLIYSVMEAERLVIFLGIVIPLLL
jgi:hypothetical protein